jgi:nucleoid DNA-binding protein
MKRKNLFSSVWEGLTSVFTLDSAKKTKNDVICDESEDYNGMLLNAAKRGDNNTISVALSHGADIESQDADAVFNQLVDALLKQAPSYHENVVKFGEFTDLLRRMIQPLNTLYERIGLIIEDLDLNKQQQQAFIISFNQIILGNIKSRPALVFSNLGNFSSSSSSAFEDKNSAALIKFGKPIL